MSTLNIELINDKELYNELLQLPEELLEQLSEEVFERLGSDISRDALSNLNSSIKDKTGNLRKSIGYSVYKNKAGVIVGARNKNGYKGYHANLIEFGTKNRWYKSKKGKIHELGAIKPKLFLRTAFESNKPTLNDIEKVISDVLKNL